MKLKLMEHQRIAYEHVMAHPYSGLLLDMGLGKTAVTLLAIRDLIYDTFEIKKVLVVAPLNVAKTVWDAEVEKWEDLSMLRVSKVVGSAKQRRIALLKKADVYVINRENVCWLIDENLWDFDMLVIDELTSFKSSKAKRFRALRKMRPKCKRVIGLTGTPAPRSYEDLWAEVFLLDGGERLEKTITRYRQIYFNPGMGKGHVVWNWVLKERAKEAIDQRLSDICISMKTEDWVSLPERIDNIISIELDEDAKKKYKKFKKDRILPTLDAGEVVGITAATARMKLLQMANGAVYDDDGKVAVIHDLKVKALQELVESLNGQPVLIFYNFKHDLDRIMTCLKGYNPTQLKGGKTVKDWNEGKVQVLVAHPASAGHGLNLQAGGNHVIWYGLTDNLEFYQQANKRLHRTGQTQTVFVHHLIAKNTVDEDVMTNLQGKAKSQNELIEALKARLFGDEFSSDSRLLGG